MNSVVRRHRGVITVIVPMRTSNPNNGQTGVTRIAAIIRKNIRKRQRETIGLRVLGAVGLNPSFPVVVTVTRVAPSSGLDPHDGLGAALKGVIDGIADGLGLKSDRDPRVTWNIDQRRGPPKYYGVEIRIAPREVQVPRDMPSGTVAGAE